MPQLDWRSRMRPGSFRGVPFLVTDHSLQFGRRKVMLEVDGAEGADLEDTGRTGDRFTVEAFVIGPAYMSRRDKLKAALQEKGPGRLVHPWLGEMVVEVSAELPRLSESTSEGGMAKFTIVFQEPRRKALPAATADTKARVTAAADKAAAASKSAFAKLMDTVHQIGAYVQKAIDTVNKVKDAIDDVRQQISAAVQFISDTAAAITNFANSVAAIIRSPLELVSGIQSVVASVMGGVNSVKSAVRSLGTLMEFGGEDAPSSPTPQARQAARNLRAIRHAFRTAAVIEVSRAAAGMTFDTAADAELLKSELLGHFDTLLDESEDDGEFAALQELRAAVSDHLDRTAIDLPRLVPYTPPVTVPSLVLAWRLYGDPLREAEICQLNGVTHPAFVPGGTELEVRSA